MSVKHTILSWAMNYEDHKIPSSMIPFVRHVSSEKNAILRM